MQLYGRLLKRGRPVRFSAFPNVAKKVRHRRRSIKFGRSERQSANGTHLLFELRSNARIERQMTGIVRPRCDLVDEKASVRCEKEFDAERADVAEGFGYRTSDLDRLGCNIRRHIRVRHRHVEYVIDVFILDHAVVCERTVRTACAYDGNFPLERDELLKHRFAAFQTVKGFFDLAVSVDPCLAFAVVAETRRFQHGRQPQILNALEEIFDRAYSAKTRKRKTVLGKECFSRRRFCVVCSTAPRG